MSSCPLNLVNAIFAEVRATPRRSGAPPTAVTPTPPPTKHRRAAAAADQISARRRCRFPVIELHVVAAMLDPSLRHPLVVQEYLNDKDITAVLLLSQFIDMYVTND